MQHFQSRSATKEMLLFVSRRREEIRACLAQSVNRRVRPWSFAMRHRVQGECCEQDGQPWSAAGSAAPRRFRRVFLRDHRGSVDRASRLPSALRVRTFLRRRKARQKKSLLKAVSRCACRHTPRLIASARRAFLGAMAFIPASKTAPKYDAIVVGSGAAGGMSAYVLAKAGIDRKSVV